MWRTCIGYMQDLAAEVKKAADEGKCYRHRDEGGQAAEVREVGQLRHLPAAATSSATAI